MCIIRLTSALASRNAPCSHLDWFPSEETIQSIVRWLKARNPYQSLLLESACNAADSLSRLNSAEFSGLSQPWSRELRKLIVHTSNSN